MILISKKIEVQPKYDKLFFNAKAIIHNEDIIVINTYTLNNTENTFLKQKPIEDTRGYGWKHANRETLTYVT